MTKTMQLVIYNRGGGYWKRNFSTKAALWKKLLLRSSGTKTPCWNT